MTIDRTVHIALQKELESHTPHHENIMWICRIEGFATAELEQNYRQIMTMGDKVAHMTTRQASDLAVHFAKALAAFDTKAAIILQASQSLDKYGTLPQSRIAELT